MQKTLLGSERIKIAALRERLKSRLADDSKRGKQFTQAEREMLEQRSQKASFNDAESGGSSIKIFVNPTMNKVNQGVKKHTDKLRTRLKNSLAEK